MNRVLAIVSVLGRDQKCVVARISTYLAENDINIEDIEQRVVRGQFLMDMLVDITDSVTPIVWGSVAVVGLVTCWLTAAYYASKAKTVRVFRERTPAWVIEVLAKAG